jgi:hypothetical protein
MLVTAGRRATAWRRPDLELKCACGVPAAEVVPFPNSCMGHPGQMTPIVMLSVWVQAHHARAQPVDGGSRRDAYPASTTRPCLSRRTHGLSSRTLAFVQTLNPRTVRVTYTGSRHSQPLREHSCFAAVSTSAREARHHITGCILADAKDTAGSSLSRRLAPALRSRTDGPNFERASIKCSDTRFRNGLAIKRQHRCSPARTCWPTTTWWLIIPCIFQILSQPFAVAQPSIFRPTRRGCSAKASKRTGARPQPLKISNPPPSRPPSTRPPASGPTPRPPHSP